MYPSLTTDLRFEMFDSSQVIEKSETKHGSGSAVYTDNFKSRIFLSRIWGNSANYINFIMLNPSTATHENLDPTVTRCFNWSKLWNFDGMFITNIFAHRSTDPTALQKAENPVGSGNNEALVWASSNSKKVIVAWGNHGLLYNRGEKVLSLLANTDLYALKITKSQTPSHPLYLPTNISPFLFR